jgi:hypothetical protein
MRVSSSVSARTCVDVRFDGRVNARGSVCACFSALVRVSFLFASECVNFVFVVRVEGKSHEQQLASGFQCAKTSSVLLYVLSAARCALMHVTALYVRMHQVGLVLSCR